MHPSLVATRTSRRTRVEDTEARFSSWQGQEEDLRGQLLARLSFRGRKRGREKLWRPDVSGVGRGARFFSEIDRKRSGSIYALRRVAARFDRSWSRYVAPPLKERKNGNLNETCHAKNLNWRRRQRRESHKELNRPPFGTG